MISGLARNGVAAAVGDVASRDACSHDCKNTRPTAHWRDGDRAAVDRWDARRREYVGPLLKQVVREIDKDPAGLIALLSEWENQNVDRLGLRPSRIQSSGARLAVS